jgi:hypothetical protein
MCLAIIEPSKTGVEHASFNMTVTKGLYTSLGDKVRLYSSSSQFDMLNMDVPWTRIPVVSITKRSFVKKVFVEAFALFYALTDARLRGFRNALLLSLFPPLLNILPLLAWLTGMKAQVILHGELDGLLDAKRQKITSYGYWVKRFFDRGRYRHTTCVILGEGIQQRLTAQYPDIAKCTYAINHPINQSAKPSVVKDIPFATFGIATVERFAEVYGRLARMPAVKRPRIVHIGMCEKALFDQFKDVVTFLCEPGKSLSVSEYEEAAARVRCALSLYMANDYKLRVSGAMLDALGAGARLISLPCSYAIDLQKDGFDVVLAQDVDEIVELMMKDGQSSSSCVPEKVWHSYSDNAFATKVIENLA